MSYPSTAPSGRNCESSFVRCHLKKVANHVKSKRRNPKGVDSEGSGKDPRGNEPKWTLAQMSLERHKGKRPHDTIRYVVRASIDFLQTEKLSKRLDARSKRTLYDITRYYRSGRFMPKVIKRWISGKKLLIDILKENLLSSYISRKRRRLSLSSSSRTGVLGQPLMYDFG